MANPLSADSARPGAGLRIGVLALQGDFREHLRAIELTGAQAVGIRRPQELDGLDGLVIPGGE
ncbi:MAG TPA: pyridoxal 5'-phosphate synthase glutaminase subunit PdxT, partial [Arthrobacter sp.]|nr:pyridoxal 5'-phosphate synthase glutaminase subunit PdxT [Arthrobacter sp.]